MATKSSFPFSAVAAVFVGAVIVVGAPVIWLVERVEPRSDRFHFNWAAMSADGALTYTAYQHSRNPPRWEYWDFDASFSKPVGPRKNPPSDEGYEKARPPRQVQMYSDSAALFRWDTYARQVRVNADRWGGHYNYRTWEEVTAPLVWWNRDAGQFDVYDRVTRLRQGSLSIDGVFVPAPGRPVQQISVRALLGSISNACLFVTGDGVFRLDLPTGPIHTIFAGPVSASGFISNTAPRPTGIDGSDPARTADAFDVFVRSGGELLRINPKGEIIARFPHKAFEHESEYSVTFKDNGRLLFQTGNPRGRTYVSRLVLMEPDGKIVRDVSIDHNEITLRMNGGVRERPTLYAPTLLPPVPGVMTTSALAQSAALCLAFCGVVVWHQKRRGVRGWRRAVWPAFAFVGGVLGALTYFASVWDERSEPCPECGKRRAISADHCSHCGAAWPRPKELGIEIRDGEQVQNAECRMRNAE